VGNNPDVSKIKIDLKTIRFEKELFAIDSNRLIQQLPALISKYPDFSNDFVYKILRNSEKTNPKYIIQNTADFTNHFRPLYDSCKEQFVNFPDFEKEIKSGLQYIHSYFPKYNIPKNLYTFIGPLDGSGNIIAKDAVYIGLQLYMGKNFSLYKDPQFQEQYPQYIIDRFEPEYISVNTMTNILDDLYPEKDPEGNLSSQMIEKGKRLYLVSKFLPFKKEFQIIGYTERQMKDCLSQENVIWDFLIQNDLLHSMDKMALKKYTEDGPKTQELGEGAPGNIGSFVGWQIVKKFMGKYPETSLQKLMETDNETIIEKAKYKP
jgi:hypothetical protein